MKEIYRKLLVVILMIFMSWNISNAQQLWPGDVDNNGIVDNVDLLYIGIAFGEIGPPRIPPSTNWQAYGFTDWGTQFPDTGLDFAYADCDGNGIINELDFDIVMMNYSFTHGVVTPTVTTQGVGGINPSMYFDTTFTNQPYINSGVAILPISLGSMALPATDFYGVSFTIEYNPNAFILAQFDLIDPIGQGDSWIQMNGPVFSSGSFPNHDPTLGILEVTIVKQDGVPIPSGEGIIGSFIGIIEENVVNLINPGGNSAETFLEINNIKFINQDLENFPIVNDSSSITIFEFDTTLLSTTDLLPDQINLYPNPAQDRIFIQMSDINLKQLIFVDQSGNEIYRKENFTKEETLEIFISEIPNGFYFVKLLTDQGVVVKKVSVQK